MSSKKLFVPTLDYRNYPDGWRPATEADIVEWCQSNSASIFYAMAIAMDAVWKQKLQELISKHSNKKTGEVDTYMVYIELEKLISGKQDEKSEVCSIPISKPAQKKRKPRKVEVNCRKCHSFQHQTKDCDKK